MQAIIRSIRFNLTVSGYLRVLVKVMVITAALPTTVSMNTSKFQQLGLDVGDTVLLSKDWDHILKMIEPSDLPDRNPYRLPKECPHCGNDLEEEVGTIRTLVCCVHCKSSKSTVIDTEGDVLKSPPSDSVVVFPVNTVGTPGKGMALHMKNNYPSTTKQYLRKCRMMQIAVGPMLVVLERGMRVAVFPTKYHWSGESDLRLIRKSANRLRHYLDECGLTECHLPRVGCGQRTGMLDYHTQVKPVLEEVFANSDIRVYVYDWVH